MKGQAFLALVFLIGTIVVLIGATLAFTANSFIDSGYGYNASIQAQAAATSGVNDALLQLDREGTAWTPTTNPYTIAVGSTTATVTVTANSPSTNYYTILSAATVASHVGKVSVVAYVVASTSQVQVVSWQNVQ
jgi:uncharacterized protein (UPF0333 family)